MGLTRLLSTENSPEREHQGKTITNQGIKNSKAFVCNLGAMESRVELGIPVF